MLDIRSRPCRGRPHHRHIVGAGFRHPDRGIETTLERHETLGILADLTGFEDMTFRAGLKDARYGFGKILQWHRFACEAVITHKRRIETLVAIASHRRGTRLGQRGGKRPHA